jgi:hypothetical protein
MSNSSLSMPRWSFLAALGCVACLAGEGRALTVQPYNTNFEVLASKLLVPGWSPVPGSVTATLATTDAIGTFDNASDLGIAEGVLLTTGTVQNALGPNTVSSRSGAGTLSST